MVLRWGVGVVQPEPLLPSRQRHAVGRRAASAWTGCCSSASPWPAPSCCASCTRARCSASPPRPSPRTGGWRRAPGGRRTGSSWRTSPSPAACRRWPPSSSPRSSRSTPPCCRSPCSRRSPPPSSGGSRRSGSPSAPRWLIGIIQSEISLFQPDIADWLGVSAASLTGLVQAVPLAIILGYMIVTGRSRLQRGETVARLPLPGSRPGVAAPARRRDRPSASASSPGSTRGPTPSSPRSPSPSSSRRSSSSPATPVSCRCASSPSPGVGAWVAARLMSANGWPFEAGAARGGGRARRSSASSSPCPPSAPGARASPSPPSPWR